MLLLLPQVEADLARKMAFVAGPRQVGKTTMALTLSGGRNAYRNWDVPADREKLLRHELPDGIRVAPALELLRTLV